MTTDLTALIESLRHYILQEHPKGSWITSDKETYAYFLQQATSVKSKVSSPTPTAPAPVPLQVIPPKPSVPSFVEKQATMAPEVSNLKPEAPIPSPSNKIEPNNETNPLPPKHFVLEKMPIVAEPDFFHLRTFFQEQFPGVILTNTIADDSGAKNIAENWKAPAAAVLILSFNEAPMENAFLSNLATAISKTFSSVKIISANKIEIEKGWDRLLKDTNLRLVIANHYSLHTLPELMKYFREDAIGKHTLGVAPLHLLSDLSLYMQQPSLKISLWKSLLSLR